MPSIWKTKSGRVAAIGVVLLGLYAVAGFVVAPRVVRSALLEHIPENIEATPEVGEIKINPFLFQVTVDHFSLSPRGGGAKLLGFERLFVDFDVSSLWHRAYTFGSIAITAPFVNAIVAQDGALNLMQLKPKAAQAERPAQPGAPLPALRIRSFKVERGATSYEDHSRPDVFSARLEPIDFELRDFSSGVEGGRFTFTGVSKVGERIEWHGHVAVQPIESDGELRIDALQVHTLWSYLQDQLKFSVDSGTIDLAAHYAFSAGNGTPGAAPANLKLDITHVALNNLRVRPKGGPAAWLTVPSLAVTGAQVDLAKRRAHVERVALDGCTLTAWREADGSINLASLAPDPPAAAPQGATGGAAAAAAPPWVYDIAQIDVHNADLELEDRSAHPAAKIRLAPLNLQVGGASQDLSKPVSVAFDTRIDDKGSLSIGGEAAAQPAAANLTLKLAQFDLSMLQPYVAQHSAMTLLSGRLGIDGKLHYGAHKDAALLKFDGSVGIDQMHTVDNVLHEDFVNWERLDIRGLVFSQSPDRMVIDEVLVRKPYARVTIETDETLNVKNVLAGGAPTTAAAAPRPAAEVHTGAVHTGAVHTGAAARMPVAIKKISIEAGKARFADLSVNPNFSAGIQALAGSITGISSSPTGRAKMDLHGAVDAYSPVTIAGEFNVLGPKLYADVSLGFHNISLPIFNPYSGKFAGYDISKGKLSTELHYKIDGRSLDAQHHLVIDQLEFGDKTASKEAVSLPIKLAVSLLKDRNGVIDLSLPVTGSLDDPKFRLAPIIWKVFVNILEKAVTAPFALLGSLFGGGPDLQFVEFPAGASALDAAGQEKARTVAKALVERPQLKVEVPIAVVPDLDRAALAKQRYDAVLLAARSGVKPAAAAPQQPFEQLEPALQLEVLTALYAKDFGVPKYPENVAAIKTKPEATAAKIDFLSSAVRQHIQIADADLQALGQQRARAVQQALLSDTQLDPERVFVAANDKAAAKDGKVRLELTLQ